MKNKTLTQPQKTNRSLLNSLSIGLFFFTPLWLLLLVAGREKFFNDPGSLWHPQVGEHMLTTGQFMWVDPFSFTFNGQPWIAHQWGAEILLALAHRLGGLDTIGLLVATIVAGLFTWLFIRLRRGGSGVPLSLLILALAFPASSYHFHARPLVMTIVFMALLLAFLVDVEAGRWSLPCLWALIPLFILWTNIHGGVLGGLATLGLVIFGWSLAWFIKYPSPIRTWKNILMIWVIGLGCALSLLVNPFGFSLLEMWWRVVDSPIIHQYAIEHFPLHQVGWTITAVPILSLIYLILLLGISPFQYKITWLIPLIWFILACTRARHGPLFAVTAVIALADMIPHVRWIRWLSDKKSVIFHLDDIQAKQKKAFWPWQNWLLVACLLFTSIILQASKIPVPILGHGWSRLNPNHWPVQLLPELQAYAQNNHDGTPIFNEEFFGGFLIYHTPRLRVFMDDRYELYGDQWMLEYIRNRDQNPQILENWAKKYDFKLALVLNGSGFDQYLQKTIDWKLLNRCQVASLYELKTNEKADQP